MTAVAFVNKLTITAVWCIKEEKDDDVGKELI